MDVKFFSLIFIFSISINAWSQESAQVDDETDYTVYESRYFGRNASANAYSTNAGGSAHSRARLFTGDGLPIPTKWSSQKLEERFAAIRDEKVIKDGNGVLRRASWLYPDDGCFARAAVANRVAFHKLYPVPSKVFAFGNLRVATNNSPRGKVGWWFHVAPIVQVKDTKYVLDPSIEPSRPLPLEEWLSRMGNPAKMKVSICESGTYSPGDNCSKESDGLELRAMNTEKYYLSLEKSRLSKLGRTADAELGDNPPW